MSEVEDRGPAWLNDGTSIEVDLRRMEEFAAKLDAEVRKRYIPHLDSVANDMTLELPPPPAEFVELVAFFQAHRETQQLTANTATVYRDATGGFAYAAGQISKKYANADAFSHARVKDVEKSFEGTLVDGGYHLAEVPEGQA